MAEARAQRPLGGSGITVPALGVGTNRWGGRSIDQVGLEAAYSAAVDTGTAFFDTAEVYTGGRSEQALGRAASHDGRPVVLASKFAPYPHRLTATQLHHVLDRSLGRLGADAIDLYYLHFPFSPRGVAPWMKAMAEAVASQKIRAVGVSNCNPAQMRTAATVLARYDVPLAANQVQYSLLQRKPEHNGVLETCRQLDVALVAYRPIGGGAIRSSSGDGGAGGTGGDTRANGSTQASLLRLLGEVAAGHRATVTQVALAWLLQRDEHVIAIPGATKAAHVEDRGGDESRANRRRGSRPSMTPRQAPPAAGRPEVAGPLSASVLDRRLSQPSGAEDLARAEQFPRRYPLPSRELFRWVEEDRTKLLADLEA